MQFEKGRLFHLIDLIHELFLQKKKTILEIGNLQLNFKKNISCNNNKIYVQMLILCLSYFITTVPVVSEEIAAIRWVNLSFDLFQSLVVILINQNWWSVIKNKMN